MARKRIVLSFPPDVVDRPIIATLIREHDVMTNIIRAEIHEDEVGRMLVELEGNGGKVREGIRFLKSLGVEVEEAISDIVRDTDHCINCGACTAVCLAKALTIGPPDWELKLDQGRCVLCGQCVDACPLQIITVKL